jgi:hypothetical protein
MFRKQFIISGKKHIFMPGWVEQEAFNYKIKLHPETDYCYQNSENHFYCLIGNWYCAENPKHNNKEILSSILKQNRWEAQLESIQKLMGIFVFIQISKYSIRIVQDAAGLQELFYHSDYTLFASEIKLLSLFCEEKESDKEIVKSFFRSKEFLKNKLFILHHTSFDSFHRLTPNHYLDSSKKNTIRYFPNKHREEGNIYDVASFAANYLKNILYAVSLRHKLAIPLTGGIDSRVLFLASLELDAKYFVSQGKGVKDNHPDVSVSTYIAKKFNKPFKVHKFEKDNDEERLQKYFNSITYPRFQELGIRPFEDGYLYVNGNVSEVARNLNGNYYKPNGAVLADWQDYANHTFPIQIYQNWLKDKPLLDEHGYLFSDFFYWEERMGSWAAKSKTEFTAFRQEFISPFNSHLLLARLLSVNLKDRDRYGNRLYINIIKQLTKSDFVKVKNIPFNPGFKTYCFRIGKSLKFYALYKQLRGLWFTFKNRKKLKL